MSVPYPTSDGTPVVLTNGVIRVGVESRSGVLVELTDLRSGHNYISRPDLGRLLRVVAPQPGFYGRHGDSHCSVADVVAGSDGKSVTVAYATLADSNGSLLGVQAKVALRIADPDMVVLKLDLAGLDRETATEVFFPWIGGLGPAEDAEHDTIIMPSTWQRSIYRPLRSLPHRRLGWNQSGAKRSWRYPVNLVTAWTDYGGRQRGLAFDVRDTSGEPQDIYIERQVEQTGEGLRANSLAMAWVFHPHNGTQGSWESPEVYIHLHEGDWQTIARQHRDWSLAHFRPADTSPEYLASIGWQFLFMRHEDGRTNYTYADLPQAARKSVACGLPNLLLFGWFEGGHDALYPEYLPVEAWGGAEALTRAITEMRQCGANPILYMNPTIWDCRTAAYQEHTAWCARSQVGSEYRESYAWANFEATTQDRAKSFAVMCPTDPMNSFTLQTVARIAGYGGPSLHFDQMVRAFSCYHPEHSHTAPQRAAIDGYMRFLPEVRRILQAANPNAILSLEGMSELHNQWGDSSWNWSQLEACEPIRLSLPLVPYSHELDAGETADVYRCFVKGLLMDFRIDGGDGLVANYPAFAHHVRRLARLKWQTARWIGRSLFEDKLGLTLAGSTFCAAAYRAEDRSYAAVIVANVGDEPARLACRVNWNALAPGITRIRRFSADENTSCEIVYGEGWGRVGQEAQLQTVDEVWDPYQTEVWVGEV